VLGCASEEVVADFDSSFSVDAGHEVCVCFG